MYICTTRTPECCGTLYTMQLACVQLVLYIAMFIAIWNKFVWCVEGWSEIKLHYYAVKRKKRVYAKGIGLVSEMNEGVYSLGVTGVGRHSVSPPVSLPCPWIHGYYNSSYINSFRIYYRQRSGSSGDYSSIGIPYSSNNLLIIGSSFQYTTTVTSFSLCMDSI